jgi:hypothetical protein
MLNALVQLNNHIPFFLRWFVDFVFEIIFLRGILAPKIASDITQHGFLRVHIIHDVVYVIKLFLPDHESRHAIWEHWQMQAKGIGHEARSIADCHDGKCGKLLALEG